MCAAIALCRVVYGGCRSTPGGVNRSQQFARLLLPSSRQRRPPLPLARHPLPSRQAGLNRQSAVYARLDHLPLPRDYFQCLGELLLWGYSAQARGGQREGVDLDVSTLADWVRAAAATLMPLVLLIRTHVFAAERIHADDTTVRVLAKGKTDPDRTAVDLCP
jgi:hypothetical protein